MTLDTSTQIDQAAVTRAVLDYYEGWFDGDPVRMERALHPELCKRSLRRGAAGAESLTTLTAPQMIGWTKEGEGRALLLEIGDPQIQVEVEDVYDTIASVTVHSTIYHEYIQLIRTRDGWKIVNVLWQATAAKGS